MINTDDVQLTISLRHDLAHTIKAYAAKEGKTPEEFIVATLWELRKERGMKQLRNIQEIGQRRSEALGIFTEEDLLEYLET